MNEEIKDVQDTQADEQVTQTADTSTPEEKVITTTQAEIDAMIKDRVAREKRNAEKAVEQAKAEAERKKLEEAQEYRALYEKTQAELEHVRTAARQAELDALKRQLLSEAGFKSEEIAESIGFITGDDEDAVKDAVERFKRVAGPRFADPASMAAGQRQQPSQKTATDYGRELFEKRRKKL